MGTSWRNENYDDGLWSSGNGELGYGDGDEATKLSYGPDRNNRYITHYFRKKFTMGGGEKYTDYSNVVSAKTYTQGFKGEYYKNVDPLFTGTKITRTDSWINFNWGTGYPHGYTTIGYDTFSVNWTGYVILRYTGSYTFYTYSDDGVKLYVNDQLIVNDWSVHAARERSGKIDLNAFVRYPIRLEYFENKDKAVAKLSWSSSQQNKEIIPPTRTFTSLPAVPSQGLACMPAIGGNPEGWYFNGAFVKAGNCLCAPVCENGGWYNTCDSSLIVSDSSCGTGAIPQCSDGEDNDGDLLIDLADPGCSSLDDNDEYNPPIVQPPAIPTGFTATAVSFSEINLQWNSVSGATSYKVERSLSSSSGFAQIANPTTSSFRDTGLEELKTYYYRIRASNSAGNSGYTSVKSAITLNRPSEGGEFEWTDLRPSSDSKMIYVSNSVGSDNNPGTENRPVKSLREAYELTTDGSPDWILLKKGDKWDVGFPDWNKKGRSNSERMVITSYGEGLRPIVYKKTSNSPIFNARVDNLAIVGIHFRGYYYDPPGDAKYQQDGVQLLYYADNILIEDNYFEGLRGGVRTHNSVDVDRTVMLRQNIAIRGNLFSNTYEEGVYMSQAKDVLVEGNVFYHIGWHEGDLRYYDSNSPKSSANDRDHAIYMQYFNENVVVKSNIFGSTFEGLALRSGGVAENNLFLRSNRAMTISTRRSVVKDNVFLSTLEMKDGQSPRGLEIMPVAKGTVVENNIVANSLQPYHGVAYMVYGYIIKVSPTPLDFGDEDMWWYVSRFDPYGVTFRNNIAYNSGSSFTVNRDNEIDFFEVSNNKFYNYNSHEKCAGLCFSQDQDGSDKFTYKNNIFDCKYGGTCKLDTKAKDFIYRVYSTRYSFSQWKSWARDSGSVEKTLSFRDPTRTIERYNSGVLGRSASYSDFIKEALKQSKDNWRTNYTADAVNDYIRQGFETLSSSAEVSQITEDPFSYNTGTEDQQEVYKTR